MRRRVPLRRVEPGLSRGLQWPGLKPGATLFVLMLVAACGGGPSSPTPVGPPRPVLTAPTAEAPVDDVAVENLRPELRIANATSDQPGERTYEFQIADNPEFFGIPGSGVLLITKMGVPEGADGKTAFQPEQDLPAPKRFHWRSRAVQGGIAGPYSAPARFKTAAAPRPPPRIASLTASSSRMEIDAEITVTAVVENTDTPVYQLVFEWTAEKGTFTGTGPRVRWRAPRGERTPATYDLKLTVLERYMSIDADGNTESRENKATAGTRVRVHDSRKEVTDLTLIFLGDFANSSVSPDTCVRNFSDKCAGKWEEREDIRVNRAKYTITGSRYSVSFVRFDEPMLWSEITAPCQFTSTVKATGKIELAKGTCLLTGVYEDGNWWLCESKFHGTTTSGLRFLF